MLPDAALAGLAWGTHPLGGVLRAALLPAEGIYRASVAARNAFFDAGILPQPPIALPCLSVGNMTVGGSGKTPMASYIASALRDAGARPAILLRGYGEDEVAVHRHLTPDIPVVVGADRVTGAQRARSQGCDVAVLDDAFQHRRARRVSDLVLVSADEPWPTRCLPAGPLREPWTALRRADLAVVTRKAASVSDAAAVAERLRRLGASRVATVRLAPERLHAVTDPGRTMPVLDLAGRSILAMAGVGNPLAFFDQLSAAGAQVDAAAFADHHAYGEADVTALCRRGESAEFVVCTLKDAVKLERLWPRSGPTLWYVSQRVVPEGGAEMLAAALDRVLAARPTADP